MRERQKKKTDKRLRKKSKGTQTRKEKEGKKSTVSYRTKVTVQSGTHMNLYEDRKIDRKRGRMVDTGAEE